MSEAKHTPGTLRSDSAFPVELKDDDGRHIATVRYAPPTLGVDSKDEAWANAERIAAAWNSCEDLSTEALESGVVGELIEMLTAVCDIQAKTYGDGIGLHIAMMNIAPRINKVLQKADGNK